MNLRRVQKYLFFFPGVVLAACAWVLTGAGADHTSAGRAAQCCPVPSLNGDISRGVLSADVANSPECWGLCPGPLSPANDAKGTIPLRMFE
jgi:hypothetical protein